MSDHILTQGEFEFKDAERTIPTCGHPHRMHNAHGLCKSCFNKRYKKTRDQARADTKRYRERHPERAKALSRASQRKRYLSPEGWIASRVWHLRRTFGITLEDYDEMLKAQGGVCAICRCQETATRKGIPKHLAVDHDHDTGKIRGLLCQLCNQIIGRAKENKDRLKAALAYLEAHT